MRILLAIALLSGGGAHVPEDREPAHRYFSYAELSGLVSEAASGALRGAGERPITVGSVGEDSEVYRFVWLRSFHSPIVVRAERRDGKRRLVGTVLSSTSNEQTWNRVDERAERDLSEGEWARLLSLVEESDLWARVGAGTAPLLCGGKRQRPPATSGDCVLQAESDGARWIVEAVRGQDRWVVYERSFSATGAFRALGLEFVRLSGFELSEDEIY